jgi:hypothetical protein
MNTGCFEKGQNWLVNSELGIDEEHDEAGYSCRGAGHSFLCPT